MPDTTPNPTAEQSGCSNPECPLSRAHSGPCAPAVWAPNPTAAQIVAGGILATWGIATMVYLLILSWRAAYLSGRARR